MSVWVAEVDAVAPAWPVGPAFDRDPLLSQPPLPGRQIGGAHFTEVNSGEGRLDLIVVHQGRRYIIETKIWRGQALYEEGVTQLADYLASEGQTTGYYVLFHARPTVYGKLPDDALEYTTEINGKTIYVYLIRLGHLFAEEIER